MNSTAMRFFTVCLALCLASCATAGSVQPAAAQDPAADPNEVRAPRTFDGLDWRMVGPYRGGRSTAVTGIGSQPATFFMGTTGGGMWVTRDFGHSWENVSDGFFDVASIGAVDVADSDPNVIYVGTGSVDIRGNTSAGRGMYRSTDSGKTWTFIGLREAGQIGRIEVHPDNPDLVYVAALGHAFGKNPERGVFRSSDGGDTWEHVLALNDSTGASDLTMSRQNPRVLFAGMWRGERKPWRLISGGEEGGVYRSTDGGDTWEKLAGGLPEGLVGKVGVSASPAHPDRVWAIIEAEPEGGVYRSDDGGATWQRTNDDNDLRQRAWYYTHVQADPQDENTVWALNTSLYRSVDAGVTFESVEVPHGDVHDLWINPHDPEVMIVADDGGGQVTVNGGETWSTYMNQPTAELYDVIVDNGFPYRLYGAQQDNTGISVPAWSSASSLHAKSQWLYPAACETGPIAFHPDDPNIVWGGCYGGSINRMDIAKDQRRNVVNYPQLQLGQAARDLQERFQWVAPIVVSPHDANVVYHASQRVHRTTDGGMTWETISHDLTTNTPEHQDFSGGPINADITGVEIYNTVFSLAVSPHSPDEIWAGTDDGRVHVTRDGGATWSDITPPDMPPLGTVDEIDLSLHQEGRAIMAVQRYRMDDFRPFVFVTDDHGTTWRLVTSGSNGIPGDYPVRTVREDPERRGLLYAGTEFGIFVSFDDGVHWQSLQLDLPVTPVTGMRVAHGDIIVATQGRSFWIMDDRTPLFDLFDATVTGPVHLFGTKDAYRANTGGEDGLTGLAPEPHPGGALIRYYLEEEPEGTVTLEIQDVLGQTVRSFTSDSATAEATGQTRLPAQAGMNRIVWDLTYPGPELDDDAVIWGFTGGVKAPPGTYQVQLVASDRTQVRDFQLLPDPRIPEVTRADYDEQFRISIEVRDSLTAVHAAIKRIRSAKAQIEEAVDRAEQMGHGNEVAPAGDSVRSSLSGEERKRSGSDSSPRHAGQPVRRALRQCDGNGRVHLRRTGGSTNGRRGPAAGTFERRVDRPQTAVAGDFRYRGGGVQRTRRAPRDPRGGNPGGTTDHLTQGSSPVKRCLGSRRPRASGRRRDVGLLGSALGVLDQGRDLRYRLESSAQRLQDLDPGEPLVLRLDQRPGSEGSAGALHHFVHG
jgi:photosystem II stability/assembly factor-like uncharacterized protein